MRRKLQISTNGYSETGRQTTRLHVGIEMHASYSLPTKPAARNPLSGSSTCTSIQEVKKPDEAVWLSRCNTTSNIKQDVMIHKQDFCREGGGVWCRIGQDEECVEG